MNNQKGFTLIEMLIVLTIISVLLILIVPNLAQKNEVIQTKGCQALVEMAQSQIQAYKIDNGSLPENLTVLVDEGYLKSASCDGGSRSLTLDVNGSVQLTP